MTRLLSTATAGPLACLVTSLLTTALVLASCTSGAPGADRPPEPPPSDATGSPAQAAPPVRAPRVGDCHRLSYDGAVAPTAHNRTVPCGDPHTAETFRVGQLDTVVDGRLLAVDSDQVQEQAATTCPGQLAAYVGGTEEQRRLSMLRAVWFTPTLAQSDAGADWFRCDAVALAEDSRLLEIATSLEGALDTDGRAAAVRRLRHRRARHVRVPAGGVRRAARLAGVAHHRAAGARVPRRGGSRSRG